MFSKFDFTMLTFVWVKVMFICMIPSTISGVISARPVTSMRNISTSSSVQTMMTLCVYILIPQDFVSTNIGLVARIWRWTKIQKTHDWQI